MLTQKKIEDYREYNKKTMLADVIPLDSPYLIQISCSDFCNFKCKFCFQSRGMEALRQDDFRPGVMTMETFKKLADQVRVFPTKVKAFRFTGFGEPLMNKYLPQMITYAKQKDLAEKVTIFTNGLLLTPQLNNQLIESGLDEVMLSLEGLSSEKYLEITKTQVDFEQLVENIGHLYEHRHSCKIFAKIIDIGLTDEDKFHTIFDQISDLAFVEYASNAYSNVEYTKEIEKNYVGEKPDKKVDVCHLPFYYMYVNWNGDVSSCHLDYTKSICFGNIHDESIVDIWNGKTMNEFRQLQLRKERYTHPVCSECNWVSVCACGIYENIIDHAAERLIPYFQ